MITPTHLFEKLSTLTKTNKILVAYSGGLDSHVLLHLVSQIKPYHVRSIHINHGLQKEADAWSQHCKNTCDELDVPIEIFSLNLKIQKGDSLEEEARKGRYQALVSSIQSDEVLLTAHHQNDQAETLLLQLFRGAGISGLASMPNISQFGKAEHARPLLDVTLLELENYAKQNDLKFIKDPSNRDTRFDRNFLRQEILPQLRSRWKGIDKTLARVASHQAEAKNILDEVAEQDFLSIHSKLDNTLSIKLLSNLSLARQKLLIRYWINKSGFQTPSEKKLGHIFADVINAQDDAQPLLEWRGAQVRRFKNHLYIMSPLIEHDSQQSLRWDTCMPIEITPLGLKLESEALKITEPHVFIRFRQGGERIHLSQKRKNISLKKYMNEVGIPPWLRSRVPLIYKNEELMQVINISSKPDGQLFVLYNETSAQLK